MYEPANTFFGGWGFCSFLYSVDFKVVWGMFLKCFVQDKSNGALSECIGVDDVSAADGIEFFFR